MNILIIDDDAVAREALALALAPLSAGDAPHLSDSARDALDALEGGYLADLVVCDVRMPDTSGIDLLELLRQDLRYSPLPIMMITASPEQAVVRQAMQLRVQGFILKPASADAAVRARTALERFHTTLAEDLHAVCKRLHCSPKQYWSAVNALLGNVGQLQQACTGKRVAQAGPSPEVVTCLNGARVLGLRPLLKTLQSLERLVRRDTDDTDTRYRDIGQELALQLQWLHSYRKWRQGDAVLVGPAPNSAGESRTANPLIRIPPVHM